MIPTLVPESAPVEVTVTSTLLHLCPHRAEEDAGTVRISWTCDLNTIELHSLAEYLGQWEQAEVSHESITDRIRHDLAALPGIADVRVVTTWDTAGMEVRCATSPTPRPRGCVTP